MKEHYAIQIFFDARDQAWVAFSEDLPGCSAGGDTPEEALSEFEIAVEAWLQALKASGRAIPKPQQRWQPQRILQQAA